MFVGCTVSEPYGCRTEEDHEPAQHLSRKSCGSLVIRGTRSGSKEGPRGCRPGFGVRRKLWESVGLPQTSGRDGSDALISYYRQAKSHYLLSNKTAAVKALTKALSRPALAQDKGLNEYLIEVYGGLPEDVRMADIFNVYRC